MAGGGGVTTAPPSHDWVGTAWKLPASSMGAEAAEKRGEGGVVARGEGGGGREMLGISLGRPIATSRGDFVYFPNSSQRTWVGRRPAGGGKEARQQGRGLELIHPVSHRLSLHSGNVAARLR